MTLLNIGQVAKRTGITVETVRFYEKQGLIAAPQRSDSGYRQYSPETVKRLEGKLMAHLESVGARIPRER